MAAHLVNFPSSHSALLFVTGPLLTQYFPYVGEIEKSHSKGLSTYSEESMLCTELWLDTCFRTHLNCKSKLPYRGLPTRVLDVESQYDKSKISLHISNKETRGSPYVTLSHCWGKGPITRLWTSNLESMRDSLEIGVLLRAFQDAIKVTRRLKIRYLWIDSLCIVQDSISDWEAESAVMGQIYEHSLVNIAATSAVDSQKGFISQRHPFLVQPCVAMFSSA